MLFASYDQLSRRNDSNLVGLTAWLLDEGMFGADFLTRVHPKGLSFYSSVSQPEADDLGVDPTRRSLSAHQVSYLQLVQETAVAARAEGLSPLEAARRCDLGRFAAWTDPERLVGNLHRAFSELNGDAPGSPLPYPAIFQEMIAFNGGEPLRCCA